MCLGVVAAMAGMLLKPRRMTDGRAVYLLKRLSPLDLGLQYELVSFDVGQGVRIAGWWISSGMSKNCAVLIHGYADAKVGAIAWAPVLNELGWNVLAIDLRAHGESGGKYSTAGYFERGDVGRVIEQIKAHKADNARELIVFGVSMGAAVAAAVGVDRGDVSAVIMESPYAEFELAVREHARGEGMPGDLFVRWALKLAEWRSGAKFEELAPVKLIPKIKGRVLVIAAGDDPLVLAEQQARIRAAVESKGDGSEWWGVEEAFHVECLGARPGEYLRKLATFLCRDKVTS